MNPPAFAPELHEAARHLSGERRHAVVRFDGRSVHLRWCRPIAGEAEAARLAWLDGRAGAPRVVGSAPVPGGFVVAAEELAATPVDSAENLLAGDDGLGRAGAALADLHRLDADDCPYRADRDVVLARAGRRVAAGLVDPADFPAGLRRYSPARLLELAACSIPAVTVDAPVVCHGRLGFDHLLLGPCTAGIVGVRALGVGDRYLDLGRFLAEVAARFGAEATELVTAGYGLDRIDRARLDAYSLLSVLL